MSNYTVFDAFTGISPFEKLGVIKFLESHSNLPSDLIQHSVDYAIKDCPSFGGYILAVFEDRLPLAVAVINKTGISSHQCNNQLVQFAIDDEFRTQEFTSTFFEKLVELTNGEISIQLNEDDVNVELIRQAGFMPHKVEYRFCAKAHQSQKSLHTTATKKRKKKNRKSKLRVAV